jgi:hypothetical protein
MRSYNLSKDQAAPIFLSFLIETYWVYLNAWRIETAHLLWYRVRFQCLWNVIDLTEKFCILTPAYCNMNFNSYSIPPAALKDAILSYRKKKQRRRYVK